MEEGEEAAEAAAAAGAGAGAGTGTGFVVTFHCRHHHYLCLCLGLGLDWQPLVGLDGGWDLKSLMYHLLGALDLESLVMLHLMAAAVAG